MAGNDAEAWMRVLRNADATGDIEAAQRAAQKVRELRATPARTDPFAGDALLSDEAMARRAAGLPFVTSPAPQLLSGARDYLGRVGKAAAAMDRAPRVPGAFGVDRGTLETFGTLVSGAVAAPAGSVAGIGAEAARGLGLTSARGEDVAERVQNALTYEPRSQGGKAQLGFLGAAAAPLSEAGADIALMPLLASPELAAAHRHFGDARAFRRIAKQSEARRLSVPVPTGEQVNEAAQKAYAQAGSSGVVASADDFAKTRDGWVQTLEREGFDPDLHPRVRVIKQRLADTQGPQAFDDLEKLRRLTLRNALTSPEAEERRLARILIDDIDSFQESSLGAAGEAGARARALWTAKRKGEEIEELLRRAELSASATQNTENAIRTEFRNLARDAKAMKRFTIEERALIEQAAKGGPLRNILRYFGKFAPSGPVPAAASVIIGAKTGGLGSAAVSAGGVGARLGAGVLAERDASRILDTIRRSAPVNPPVPAVPGAIMPRPTLSLPPPALIAASQGANSAIGSEELRRAMVEQLLRQQSGQ